VKVGRLFQTGVKVSRTAAVRGVAGNVQELTFLFAFRAGLRGQRGSQSIAAFTAFPKSLGWSRRSHGKASLSLVCQNFFQSAVISN
jgi:hypothetical protein